MRRPFIETLTAFAEKDPKVILIIGDVGFSFIEPYKQRFPNQFLNTGVCEQTMMGIAAGMSRMGWKPYVYTMRNFIAFRPYEQVRNDIAFGKANVKLFGVTGSAAYKFLGFSHNVINGETPEQDEDVQMFKRLPNMNVHIPKTEEETVELLKTEYERMGPAYFII